MYIYVGIEAIACIHSTDTIRYKDISELGSSATQSSGRSFMYIKNNNHPNMLLCGIPLNMLNHDECSPFKTTHGFHNRHIHRKSFIHKTNYLFEFLKIKNDIIPIIPI